MKIKSFFRKLLSPVTGLILVFTLSLAPVINPHSTPDNPILTTVYADPITPENTADPNTTNPTTNPDTTPNTTPTPDTTENDPNNENNDNNDNDNTNNNENTEDDEPKTCYDQVEGLGWLVCPTTGLLANIIDSLYGIIEDFLVVNPLENSSDSPIYSVWQYARDITNIVFVIFLLIVVWSQLTGLGISNYGIKRTLPRIIVAAILVNLSYLICTLAVDISNILGVGIKNFLYNIAANASANTGGLDVSFVDMFSAVVAGGTVGGIAIAVTGGLGHFLWMFLGVVLAGVISVVIGFITIAMRQAVVSILVMISPLAFVCYLLPNTEKWFDKWKKALTSMLVFYPMFAGLFGASQLAGWAIMASANGNVFFIILGAAVRILPLFMAGSMMKMSGTVLAGVGAGLNKLVNPARRGIRGWTGSYAEMHKQRYIANSPMPAAGLRRYLDAQARKRALNIKSNTESRLAQAEIRAQRMITTGGEAYDPGKKQTMKTSVFTRDAKAAMNRNLEAQTAALDAQHILGNYGEYHHVSTRDHQLAAGAGANFLDYTRAELASVNDSYADIDWLMGKYDSYRKLGAGNYQHDRYITGAAGALGHMGDNTVLGQVIGKAAKNEAARRQATANVFAKYGYNKTTARDMLVGYYVNDDGIATEPPDEFGNRKKIMVNGKPEQSPGEFLKYHPEALHGYDKYELVSDGKGGVRKKFYYETKDQDGKVVTRIYKDDGPAMKEAFANWDMTIQDPIDGLYGILSGIKEGDIKVPGLEGVGLSRLSTTLGRAFMSSKFSEKASFAGPMYATSVSNRYIKDYVHQNIARLDNLIKTGKPSKFNTQDFAELEQLKFLMNPDNWEKMLFNEESLYTYRNVNGKKLEGTRIVLGDDGKPVYKDGKVVFKTIPHDEATPEDLKNTIIVKFLNPAATRFTTMMTRITQGTIDNQKPGVAQAWIDLAKSMEWKEKGHLDHYTLLEDPYAEQTESDVLVKSRDIHHRLIPNRGRQNGQNGNNNGGTNGSGGTPGTPIRPGGGPINPTGGNPYSAGAPASGQSYSGTGGGVSLRDRVHDVVEAQARREARGGMDPIYTDEQLAEEEARLRAIDEEYAREWQNMGNLDPSDNPNIMVRIANIADSCYDGESFYEQAIKELEAELPNDQTGQLAGIIDQLEQFHATHIGAELQQYRDEFESALEFYYGLL